ncbi:thioredoxin domain-containing protein [Spirosoma gilvum]
MLVDYLIGIIFLPRIGPDLHTNFNRLCRFGKRDKFMNTGRTKRLVPNATLPVLLTFISADDTPFSSVREMVNELQYQLDGKIRVLKIEAAAHPAIVRSFGLQRLPAFVLLLQGTELWRQEGLPDTNLLNLLPRNLLQA